MLPRASIPQRLRALISLGLEVRPSALDDLVPSMSNPPEPTSGIHENAEGVNRLSDADLARQGLSRGLLALRHGDPRTS